MRWLSKTGSAKPGLIGPAFGEAKDMASILAADHGEEVDPRGSSLGGRSAPAGSLSGTQRFDHPTEQAFAPVLVLQHRVEQGGQFRVACVAAGDIAVPDGAVFGLHDAARDGHLAHVEPL